MSRQALRAAQALCVVLALQPTAALAAPPDIVLYASDAVNLRGNWALVADSSAAGGRALVSADAGWSTPLPLMVPIHYFEFTFTAPANIPYRMWVRMKAANNSKWNDSVFGQFSDAVTTSGTPLYPIGSIAARLLNLATTAAATSLNGWGWVDGAYWLAQTPTIQFTTTGTHTLRIQTREDGVQIDQVVLSAGRYLTAQPGPVSSDNTIVAKVTPGPTPFSGTAAPIPGSIEVEQFDNGGEGVAYHDLTAGNAGGQYRKDDVDIEATSTGSYDVGWTDAGEWLNYTVNVAAAGAYTVTFRVSSASVGGKFHLEMNGTNVTGPLTVPNTGNWQVWQTITKNVTLTAGRQNARLVMDSIGVWAVGNFDSMEFVRGSTTVTPTPYSLAPASLPGTVAAANFDNGGEGVAYHDVTSGNAGGAYRTTDVDLEVSSLGGYDVGWTSAGEWLTYTVNVAATGTYDLQFLVASPTGGGQLHAAFGATTSPVVTVPNTGSWQKWVAVGVPVTVTAGQQLMKVFVDAPGFNLASIALAAPPPPPTTPPPPPPPPSTRVPTTYSAISDRVVRPKPALPPLGPAGYKFTDPTFGTPMLRVTDAFTRPSSVGQSYRSPSETPNRAWNSTSTRFVVGSTDGTNVPFAFDPATMTASRIPGAQDGGLILKFNTEVEFSIFDPDVCYGGSSQYDHAVVTSYNFRTNSYTVVADVRSIVPGVDDAGRTYLRGVETGGTTTEYMAFIFGGQAQDQDRYAVWFPVGNLAARKLVDTVSSTINGVPTNIPLGFRAHAVAIDQSGRYVVIGATVGDVAAGKAPNYVWDTSTDRFTPIYVSPGGHGALGYGVSVNNPDDSDSMDWMLRGMSAVGTTRYLIWPFPTPGDFKVSSHASWSNAQPDQLVPILAAMFRYGNNTGPWREWDEEIIGIRTDGAESRVWRFAHHRSDYNHNGAGDTNAFWYTPRPNISPDGQWAIFTSNWEKTLGDDRAELNKRQDVFVVKLQ